MKNKKDDKFLETLKDFIKSLAVSLIIVIVLTQFFVRPSRVDGLSMYPTLDDQETGFSNILAVKISEIERFDIVVVYLESQDKNIVKRVIGLPGDTIEYRDDVLYINEKIVNEPFLDNDYAKRWLVDKNQNFTADYGPIVVPEDSYFLLGDNRPNSSDSRRYGTFEHSTIKSRDLYIIFPFSEIRKVGR